MAKKQLTLILFRIQFDFENVNFDLQQNRFQVKVLPNFVSVVSREKSVVQSEMLSEPNHRSFACSDNHEIYHVDSSTFLQSASFSSFSAQVSESNSGFRIVIACYNFEIVDIDSDLTSKRVYIV